MTKSWKQRLRPVWWERGSWPGLVVSGLREVSAKTQDRATPLPPGLFHCHLEGTETPVRVGGQGARGEPGAMALMIPGAMQRLTQA